MLRVFTAKRIIKLGLLIYSLYYLQRMFFFLGYEESADAAFGFLVGLICMASIWLVIKCCNFLVGEATEWIDNRKIKKQFYL